MVEFRELTERYRLEKILKSTRAGTVLRATDQQSGGPVVVKLIPLASPAVLEAGAPQFERLAATVAALRHPHLPTILDSGFSPDGNAFLVMEVLEGWGLDSLTEAPATRILGLVEQALNGLEALASRGLAHGSVAPDNVFVLSSLDWDRVKLLGLGSAIFRDPAAPGSESARFRAPELARPGAMPDVRSDIYSLALTACHALRATVGGGESPVVQLPLAVSFALDNDEALRQALERSLRQDPAERPSLREIREGIRLAVGSTATVSQPPAPAPAPAAAPPFLAAVPEPLSPQAPAPPARPAAVAPEMLAAIPEAWNPAGAPPVASPRPAAMTLPDPLPDLPERSGAGPEPAEEDEVLSTIDDEVLNAFLSVPAPGPWPADRPAGQDGAGGPAAPPRQGPAAAPARKTGLLGRPAVLLGAAALVTVVCVGAIAWGLMNESPEPEVAAAAPVTRPKPSGPPASERLREALTLFEQGEDDRARLILSSLTPEDQASLRPDQCRSLRIVEEVLGVVAVERLPEDLATGLARGDLGKLRTAVVASESASGLAPEVQQDLERARSVVEIYEQARSAAAARRHAEVLERFASLESLLPAVSDPEELRNKAASALEGEAAELVLQARYDQALARLDPVRRTWADREGLADLVEAYETHKRNEPEQERILAALPGIERRKKPKQGLDALDEVQPTPHLAPRIAEARKRLEAQLAQLDGQPPQVVLRDGYRLDFSRGAVVELSFRATDDYEVRSVRFMARPQGGKWREIPFEPSRTGYYTVELPPAFHSNGPVDFYVVATDLSGREGVFGTRDQPQQLKPLLRGFERLVQ